MPTVEYALIDRLRQGPNEIGTMTSLSTVDQSKFRQTDDFISICGGLHRQGQSQRLNRVRKKELLPAKVMM